jgi:hypothetical protein
MKKKKRFTFFSVPDFQGKIKKNRSAVDLKQDINNKLWCFCLFPEARAMFCRSIDRLVRQGERKYLHKRSQLSTRHIYIHARYECMEQVIPYLHERPQFFFKKNIHNFVVETNIMIFCR